MGPGVLTPLWYFLPPDPMCPSVGGAFNATWHTPHFSPQQTSSGYYKHDIFALATMQAF